MFLRKVRPKGKVRRPVYWELVESYRTPRGSRQRTVAYLGKLSGRELNGWQMLSRNLEGKGAPLPSLFQTPESWPEGDYQWVDVKGLKVQRLRRFGDVYLGWTIWRMLGLDKLLEKAMPAGQEEVPWSLTAAILCIARLCRPSSELHIEKHFYPESALEDLLGVEAAQVHTDRLYAGLDRLLPLKKTIEAHLRERLGQLFTLSYDLLLYDLTSTYFEGVCAANPMARRGYSRDSRGDCPQVVIALIVTTDGYPLGYEVFDGNTQDVTTVPRIIAKVEQEHGKINRIWVMDRGNVSEENLAFIRGQGGRYIVGTPKAMLRQVQGQISDEGWHQVREGIEVKVVPSPVAGPGTKSGDTAPTETFILCRSADRVHKEQAMLDRFVTAMRRGLEKLAQAAQTGRLHDLAKAHQRLGRLQEKNWRAAACFQVSITALEKPLGQQTLTVRWTVDQQAKQRLCGCYLLRTNLPQVDPVNLWRQYIQLVDAEWAFRISKDELEIRPVWHQHQDRVLGHILVCFVAYAMWKTLAGWMKISGLGDAPRPLLEELAGIHSGDVVLPTRTAAGIAGPHLVVRCVTRPSDHQAVLLHRLGLTLPNQIKRFRLPQQPAPARRQM